MSAHRILDDHQAVELDQITAGDSIWIHHPDGREPLAAVVVQPLVRARCADGRVLLVPLEQISRQDFDAVTEQTFVIDDEYAGLEQLARTAAHRLSDHHQLDVAAAAVPPSQEPDIQEQERALAESADTFDRLFDEFERQLAAFPTRCRL